MAIPIRSRGIPQGGNKRVIGRVSRAPVEKSLRSDYLRVVSKVYDHEESFDGYAAVLFEGMPLGVINVPHVHNYEDIEFLQDRYVAAVEMRNGFTRVLYRPDSPHNALFATERCNSNCLMCSQPPREIDDSEMASELIRLIDLIPNRPEQLGISGGEPTLLKDGLIQVITRLKECLPDTAITMLSNGRMYSYEGYVAKLAAIGHTNFLTSIPLYANNATDHDFVVQTKGAFDQTIQGLYNAARMGLAVELRVVLHKQTVPGLLDLTEFIYRNLPFVTSVALMGMENMGHVKKNWELLWVDPIDYAETLEAAVRQLYYRRIRASIYNLPLCVLPESLWSFARKSISDFKNIYLEECTDCSVKEQCGGLFQSSEKLHSRAIQAIKRTIILNNVI